jgi:aspartyl-tRNA synthetase
VRLAGWIHRKRDHGQLLFVDLRDHYGLTQCVVDVTSPIFKAVETLKIETVIAVGGRGEATLGRYRQRRARHRRDRDRDPRGRVLGADDPLPSRSNADAETPEDLRLRYRFLDLRHERIHRNIVLRSGVVASIRRRMTDQGFIEIQTPILTSSSPEGARDYLVPSRLSSRLVLRASAGAPAVSSSC